MSSVHRKTCRHCGQPIELREEADGTWRPYDRGGGLHDCPGRAPGPGAGSRGAGGAKGSRSAKGAGGARQAAAPAPAPVAPPGRSGPNPLLVVLLVGALAGVGWWWLEGRTSGPPLPEIPGVSQVVDGMTGGDGAPGETGGKDGATGSGPQGKDAPCGRFDSQVWAQSVYDQNPKANAAMAPDGTGLVCDWLPLGAAPALWTDRLPDKVQQVEYVDTIDGDTIIVRMPGGKTEHVRLLMINTPETGKGTRPLECFGAEATDFTRSMLGWSGGTLWLEQDVENRDKYNRLLRYVWFKAGGDVYMANEAIVRSGYANQYTHSPNVRYDRRIGDAERFARSHKYGLWSACR